MHTWCHFSGPTILLIILPCLEEPETGNHPIEFVPESGIPEVYLPSEEGGALPREAVDVEEEHQLWQTLSLHHQQHRLTLARISIPAHAPIPFLSKEETPSLPLLVSPPLPTSPPPLHASPTYPLGFRAAMIRQRAKSPSTSHSLPLPPPIILSHTRASMSMMRAAAPSTYILASRSETPPSGTSPLLPISLPTPSPPFSYPLLTVERTGPRVNYGFVATLDAKIRRDLERDVGYGITNTWDEMIVGMPGAPATDDTELGRQMTKFATMVRQDTYEFYGRLDEAQDARGGLSGRFNLLQKDRCSHSYTALLMEREAKLSCEAWRRSMAASDAARSEVMALRTTVLGQQAEIVAL
ncbi:hypothetical protein Tco_0116149 [Tanacetum coccineum]